MRRNIAKAKGDYTHRISGLGKGGQSGHLCMYKRLMTKELGQSCDVPTSSEASRLPSVFSSQEKYR